MRTSVLLFAGGTLLLWAHLASGISPDLTNHRPTLDRSVPKPAATSPSSRFDPMSLGVGGDTIESAIVIPSVPYYDTGNTCSYASDYESCVGCFECPFDSTGARDVVYAFTPPDSMTIVIDLCASSYDTKVYLVEGDIDHVIDCNDDRCGTGLPGPWQSRIPYRHLAADHTYYLIVDGWSAADCGEYDLAVTQHGIPPVPCPAGSQIEGEPVCFDGYVDEYNGGCSSSPPVFTSLRCSPQDPKTVCGTYGGYVFGDSYYRDLDWYEIEVYGLPTPITWCVEGSYETCCGFVDGREGCDNANQYFEYAQGPPLTRICVSSVLPPGRWWLLVGTSGFGPEAGLCGGEYVAELTGWVCSGVAVRPTTWGAVKATYRE